MNTTSHLPSQFVARMCPNIKLGHIFWLAAISNSIYLYNTDGRIFTGRRFFCYKLQLSRDKEGTKVKYGVIILPGTHIVQTAVADTKIRVDSNGEP